MTVLTIMEAAATLRCGRSRVWELISDGTLIRAPKFGRCTTVYAESVFDALEKGYDPPAARPKRIRTSRGQFAEDLKEVLKEARSR